MEESPWWLVPDFDNLPLDSGDIAKKAMTIAIRYAAIRRQFGAKNGDPETKILDYIIHQHRLMPLLAETVRFLFY
jgi:acyl-CoA oxidase